MRRNFHEGRIARASRGATRSLPAIYQGIALTGRNVIPTALKIKIFDEPHNAFADYLANYAS